MKDSQPRTYSCTNSSMVEHRNVHPRRASLPLRFVINPTLDLDVPANHPALNHVSFDYPHPVRFRALKRHTRHSRGNQSNPYALLLLPKPSGFDPGADSCSTSPLRRADWYLSYLQITISTPPPHRRGNIKSKEHRDCLL